MQGRCSGSVLTLQTCMWWLQCTYEMCALPATSSGLQKLFWEGSPPLFSQAHLNASVRALKQSRLMSISMSDWWSQLLLLEDCKSTSGLLLNWPDIDSMWDPLTLLVQHSPCACVLSASYMPTQHSYFLPYTKQIYCLQTWKPLECELCQKRKQPTTEPTLKSKKLRLLCLHGFRSTGNSMKNQNSSFFKSIGDLADLYFLDGPHKLPFYYKADDGTVLSKDIWFMWLVRKIIMPRYLMHNLTMHEADWEQTRVLGSNSGSLL